MKRHLNEAEIVLKRRKKSVEKFLDAEMAKRGFVRAEDRWLRAQGVAQNA